MCSLYKYIINKVRTVVCLSMQGGSQSMNVHNQTIFIFVLLVYMFISIYFLVFCIKTQNILNSKANIKSINNNTR